MDSKTLQNFALPGAGYGYTGTNVNDLTSSENTIVTGLIDQSGSTTSFWGEIEKCIQQIIHSLRHCPASDKLMYRHCHFDTDFVEVHGFKPLSDCHEDDYKGIYSGGGQTALYNSCDKILRSTLDYAAQQASKRYTVNGINFIITDGMDYLSSGKNLTPNDVKKTLEEVNSSEVLESLITILIGVNKEPSVRKGLEAFHKAAGFTQFIEIENADERTLAKLAKFISESVSSQSQALGTGGPSQSLTF